MQAILLAGESVAENSAWMSYLERGIKKIPFTDVYPILYSHWTQAQKTGRDPPSFNVDIEMSGLIKIAKRIKEEYLIVSKSSGLAMTLQCIRDKTISPVGIVGCGLPMHYPLEEPENEKWVFPQLLKSNNLSTWILQNTNERYIHPEELEQVLSENSNYRVISGDTHEHKYSAVRLAQHVAEFRTQYLQRQ